MTKIKANSANMYNTIWRDPVRWLVRLAAVAVLACECLLPFVSTKDGFWYNAVSIYTCLACSLPQVALVCATVISFIKFNDKHQSRVSETMCLACALPLLLRLSLVLISLTDCDFRIHWGFYLSFAVIATVAFAVSCICFRQGRIMIKNNKYHKEKAAAHY